MDIEDEVMDMDELMELDRLDTHDMKLLSRAIGVNITEDSTVVPMGNMSVPCSASTLSAVDWLPILFSDLDFRACLESCNKIVATKGVDYTGGSDNRLANFDEAAAFLGTTPLKIWGTYFFKHVTAILSYCKRSHVESEPIDSRIADCINYLLLLLKMVRRERSAK